jgi:pimeloyl-ACP methyl ester carboxylesterase
MTAHGAMVAVLVAIAMLQPAAAAGQDTPIVFVHGIFSNGDEWRRTSARLVNTLRIEPHVVDLPSTAVFEQQTATLDAAKRSVAAHAIAIGHSQGGLISRQWNRTKPLKGIVTMGTPHSGSQLTMRSLDLVNFHYLIYNLTGLMSAWGTGTEYAWIYAGIYAYLQNTQVLAWSSVLGLGSTIAVTNSVAVAPQLVPGSAFLTTLNGSGNLSREASAVSYRVGLVYTADQYWRAGIAVGLAPDQRNWVWGVMLTTPPVLEYAAAVVDQNYGPWNLAAQTFALRLRQLAGVVRDMDPQWCWGVTGDRQCRIPHDGIVAVPDQHYPGGMNFAVYGPAHIQERQRSDSEITAVLTQVMKVPARGSSSPAPGSGGGGGGSGADSLAAGERLYADQEIRSAGGTTALRYQGDGNLVLYGTGGSVLWASDTDGAGAGYVEMQGDGNFVIYEPSGRPVWATMTQGSGLYLRVHDDGFAMIHDGSGAGVWWTGSGHP